MAARSVLAAALLAVVCAAPALLRAESDAAGVATVREESMRPDLVAGLIDVTLDPAAAPSRRTLLSAKRERGRGWALLARLVARGDAAGSLGDVYDNRDRGHSRLAPERHPFLRFTDYEPALIARGMDYGLNTRLRFDAPTLGNASAAIKHPVTGRSLPRAAMTSKGTMARVEALYRANHLYVYPEHRDHDAVRGDRFPANAPQMVVSQGSSGSDKAFLQAITAIYAAYSPATKRRLVEERLLAPTTQMILRRGMAGMADADAYMSGMAHPSAFDGARIELERMVALANALEPEAIPPAVRLRVVAEDTPVPRVEVLGDGLGEALFDTGAAVARVAHGLARDRRYVLSVEDTTDPNDRPLRFHWRVLRGPGSTVRPLDPAGRVAEATVRWTPPYAAPGAPDLETSRVDIAVFADNGRAPSAPAILSVAFPPRQHRVYAEDGRILSVDYDVWPERYADPLLFPRRAWRDDMAYDAAGRRLGWTRTHPDGSVQQFAGDGRLILAMDGDGRPRETAAMRYPIVAERGQAWVTAVPDKPADGAPDD